MLALIGTRKLVEVVIQLATSVEPWAEVVLCSISDFVASGAQGMELRIPIAKPMTMDQFRRPRWNETIGAYLVWDEADKNLPPLEKYDMVHIVAVRPDRDVQVGELEIDVDQWHRPRI